MRCPVLRILLGWFNMGKTRKSKPTEDTMKTDVLAAAKAGLLADQDGAIDKALGASYDGGLADAPVGTGGGFSQADVDAKVAEAVAPLNQSIADLTAKDAADIQAGVDAKAASDAALADLQVKFDALTAVDVADKALVANFQGSLTALSAALDALKAAVPTAP